MLCALSNICYIIYLIPQFLFCHSSKDVALLIYCLRFKYVCKFLLNQWRIYLNILPTIL
jgi:hypothetical protein